MKIIKHIGSIACFFINLMIGADPIITFNFKPYPTFPSEKYCHEVIKDLGAMSRSCRLGILDHHLIGGIEVTYSGYLTVSDSSGEVSFPHKPTHPTVDVLVTKAIIPVMMVGNTVHHWELKENSNAKFFRYTFKKDPLSPLTYWDVQPQPLPTYNMIPLQTLIILANPDYVEIPVGTTPMPESANMVLPDIYIKKGIKNTVQALYAMNIKHLFGGIQYLNKSEPTRSMYLINP